MATNTHTAAIPPAVTAAAAAFVARETAAIESFVDYCALHARLTRGEALRAWDALRSLKVLKADIVAGGFKVTHGVFLEPDVLRRAAQMKG